MKRAGRAAKAPLRPLEPHRQPFKNPRHRACLARAQVRLVVKKGLHLQKVSRNLCIKFWMKRDTVLSIPDFQTLMLPVLRIAAEGEVRISDVVERLAGEFTLSADERSHLLPSGRQTTFANRVHWAKSYLGKAGLVELTKRAHFRITEDGRKVLAAPPERIDIKYLNRFPSFRQFREAGGEGRGRNHLVSHC